MREASIEGQAIIHATLLRFITFKVSPAKSDGYPDRVFINERGLHIYIEIKAPGKRPRKLQIYRINSLRERNVPAFWSDNINEIRELLDFYARMDPKDLSNRSYPPYDFAGKCGDTS